MTNESSRARLVRTMIRKDLRTLRHHGLFGLIGFSLLLFGLGMVFHVRILREVTTYPTFEWTSYELSEQAGEVAPPQWSKFAVNGLELLYGYALFASLVLSATAFVTSYGSEMRRGTVRTLTCYPVGFFEITLAKLLYAWIVGTIGSLVVLVGPWLTLGTSPLVPVGALLVASLATLFALSIGAFGAGLLARVTGRMRIRPTTLGVMVAVLSYVFTQRFLEIVLRVTLSNAEPMKFLLPLVRLSPYHQLGGFYAWAIGGPPPPVAWVLGVAIATLAAGLWASARILPDCYERD